MESAGHLHHQEHIFALQVFIHAVADPTLPGLGVGCKSLPSTMRSSLLQDLALSKAVAVRLLAYPLLTLRPAAVELAYGPFVTHMVGGGDEPESVSFEPMLPFASGKSCTFTARPDELHHALQKCPLHVMYVDVAPGGPPSVRGAAFMRLEIQDPDDASADIKTNAVETLALYDGSSRRMGHITLAARLVDHGAQRAQQPDTSADVQVAWPKIPVSSAQAADVQTASVQTKTPGQIDPPVTCAVQTEPEPKEQLKDVFSAPAEPQAPSRAGLYSHPQPPMVVISMPHAAVHPAVLQNQEGWPKIAASYPPQAIADFWQQTDDSCQRALPLVEYINYAPTCRTVGSPSQSPTRPSRATSPSMHLPHRLEIMGRDRVAKHKQPSPQLQTMLRNATSHLAMFCPGCLLPYSNMAPVRQLLLNSTGKRTAGPSNGCQAHALHPAAQKLPDRSRTQLQSLHQARRQPGKEQVGDELCAQCSSGELGHQHSTACMPSMPAAADPLCDSDTQTQAALGDMQRPCLDQQRQQQAQAMRATALQPVDMNVRPSHALESQQHVGMLRSRSAARPQKQTLSQASRRMRMALAQHARPDEPAKAQDMAPFVQESGSQTLGFRKSQRGRGQPGPRHRNLHSSCAPHPPLGGAPDHDDPASDDDDDDRVCAANGAEYGLIELLAQELDKAAFTKAQMQPSVPVPSKQRIPAAVASKRSMLQPASARLQGGSRVPTSSRANVSSAQMWRCPSIRPVRIPVLHGMDRAQRAQQPDGIAQQAQLQDERLRMIAPPDHETQADEETAVDAAGREHGGAGQGCGINQPAIDRALLGAKRLREASGMTAYAAAAAQLTQQPEAGVQKPAQQPQHAGQQLQLGARHDSTRSSPCRRPAMAEAQQPASGATTLAGREDSTSRSWILDGIGPTASPMHTPRTLVAIALELDARNLPRSAQLAEQLLHADARLAAGQAVQSPSRGAELGIGSQHDLHRQPHADGSAVAAAGGQGQLRQPGCEPGSASEPLAVEHKALGSLPASQKAGSLSVPLSRSTIQSNVSVASGLEGLTLYQPFSSSSSATAASDTGSQAGQALQHQGEEGDMQDPRAGSIEVLGSAGAERHVQDRQQDQDRGRDQAAALWEDAAADANESWMMRTAEWVQSHVPAADSHDSGNHSSGKQATNATHDPAAPAAEPLPALNDGSPTRSLASSPSSSPFSAKPGIRAIRLPPLVFPQPKHAQQQSSPPKQPSSSQQPGNPQQQSTAESQQERSTAALLAQPAFDNGNQPGEAPGSSSQHTLPAAAVVAQHPQHAQHHLPEVHLPAHQHGRHGARPRGTGQGDRPDLDLSASFASDGGDILTDYSASPDREEPSVPSILKRPSVQHAAAPGRSLFPTESFMADAGICDASFEADPAQGITTGGEFDASNAAANRPSNQDSPGDGPYLTSFTGGGTQTFQSVATAATATRAPGAILAVRRPYRNSSGS